MRSKRCHVVTCYSCRRRRWFFFLRSCCVRHVSADEGHAEAGDSSSRSLSERSLSDGGRDPRLPAGAGAERTTKRGSMVIRKNKISKSSSAKLHSSVYSKKQINAAIKIQKWYRVRRLLSAVEVAMFYNKSECFFLACSMRVVHRAGH